jgi:hypothetical protein
MRRRRSVRDDRRKLVSEALRLELLTIGWMTIEAVAAVWAGIVASSLTGDLPQRGRGILPSDQLDNQLARKPTGGAMDYGLLVACACDETT